VRQAIASLKAEYPAFRSHELAKNLGTSRAIAVACEERDR
jgi:hypothetical protein